MQVQNVEKKFINAKLVDVTGSVGTGNEKLTGGVTGH
jgi:hypothetical protein